MALCPERIEIQDFFRQRAARSSEEGHRVSHCAEDTKESHRFERQELVEREREWELPSLRTKPEVFWADRFVRLNVSNSYAGSLPLRNHIFWKSWNRLRLTN